MEFPKISIVTPCYNMAEFLEETILSVLDQKYPNLEYIIIDGGSTDGSVEIIKKYESRLSFWVSEPDKGMYDAIQKGFGRATGDIFAWINADDKYFGWTLKTVASIFSKFDSVDWLISLRPAHCDYTGQLANIGKLDCANSETFYNHLNIPNGAIGVIQQESSFWRKTLYQKVAGIDTSYKLAGDFDLWAKFFHFAEPHGVELPLAQFRKTPNQLSSNKDAYLAEVKRSLEVNKMEVKSLQMIAKKKSLSFLDKVLFKLSLQKRVRNLEPPSTKMAIIKRKYINCVPHWEEFAKTYKIEF